MATVVACTNQKGGVGKTTSAASIAFSLAETGHSTLLVDLDGQGHSSIYLTGDVNLPSRRGGAEQIFNRVEGLRGTPTSSGVDVLHGHMALKEIDDSGQFNENDVIELREYVKALPYDFIVIDTPPALQLRQFAAMVWADVLMVVAEPEEKAMRGFRAVKKVIDLLQSKQVLPADYKWRLLFNNVDSRIIDQQRLIEGVSEVYKANVIPISMASRKALVNKAYSARVPVWKLKETPKDVGAMWKSLPNMLGIV